MSDSRTDIEIPATGLLPEAEPHVEGERQKTPRELTMERIAAHAEEVRQREFAQSAIYDADAKAAGLAFPSDEPEQDTGQAPDEHPAAAPDADTAPVSPTTPAAPVAPLAPQHPQLVSVEIDGNRMEVTQDQLLYLARMGIVANQTLHQWQQQQFAPPQPQQPAPVQRALPIDEGRIRETAKKIQYGNEDDATAALSDLIQTVYRQAPQAPPVDEQRLINRAVLQAQMQAQLIADTTLIKQEYPKIFADPQRELLAKLNVDAIRQRNISIGKQQSELETYREAGDRVYAALGEPTRNQPAPPSPPPPNLVIRRSVAEIDGRKKAAPRPVSQIVDRRSQVPEGPKPKTASDIVEEMRAKRGQTPMR